MKEIYFTEKESAVFGNIIGNELTKLVNEYDPDTQRKPSRQRFSKFEMLKDIYERWTGTQKRTKTASGLEIVFMSPAKECRICISEDESSAAEKLVKGFLETAEKHPQLIQDDELAAAKNVLKKLQSCRTADFAVDCYRQRKFWHRQKDGSYISYSGPEIRFTCYKAYDRTYGGDCWKVRDRVTGDKEYGRTFAECRNSAAHMAYVTAQRTPEEYAVGMTAYTWSGSRVRIDSIGEKGCHCWFTYLSGDHKSKKDYIDEVNHLYIRKTPEPGDMSLLQ